MPRSDPLKVANVLEDARWGGPQVRIVNVASRLKEHGVHTVIVHPEKNSSRLVEKSNMHGVENLKIQIHRLTKHIPTLAKYVTYFASEVISLSRSLGSIDPDLVHCNGAWQIKGILAAKIVGIPAVWHLNDTSMPFPVRAVFKGLAPHLADGVITASKRTWSYYIEDTALDRKPHATIQAPVDTEEFNPDRVEPHAKLSSLSGLKVVTVASVTPSKGLEYFIDMCAEVDAQTYKDIHFFIVGPILENKSEYGEQLRNRVKRRGCESVHFTGHSHKVREILKAADVYVCSSRSEASPISVWEAMAMKLPVVSTDVGDVRRLLRESNTAECVVEVGDSGALAEKVIRFLKDENLRQEVGENNREIAHSKLDIRTCANKHNNFYRTVISLNKEGVNK